MTDMNSFPQAAVFEDFASPIRVQSPMRKAITNAYRLSEQECVGALVEQATLPEETRQQIRTTAARLIEALRA